MPVAEKRRAFCLVALTERLYKERETTKNVIWVRETVIYIFGNCFSRIIFAFGKSFGIKIIKLCYEK